MCRRAPTVWAGHLSAQGGLDLLVDQRSLDGGKQVLGLARLQPQGVEGQGFAFQGEHLTDFGRLVVGGEDDLHGDLHAALFPVMPGQGLVDRPAVEALQPEQRQ